MNKQTEALKLALEALENFDRFRRIMTDGPDISDKLLAEDYAEMAFVQGAQLIPAIREALAEQPAQQQEPVAMHEDWYDSNSCGHCGMVGGHASTCRHYKPTSPPANANTGKPWVGLTDEEYSQLHDGFHQQGKLLGWVVDQVEAKLREKNNG